MKLKSDAKLKEKLTCGFKYDEEFGRFSPNHSRVRKFHFDLRFKLKKIKRSYLS